MDAEPNSPEKKTEQYGTLGSRHHAVHPAPNPLDFELLLRDAADHSGPGTRSRLSTSKSFH